MNRDFLVVYTNLRDKPNYRRMSPAGRGCLLHVWMLGSDLGPDRAEGCWPNRDELLDVLELDGFLASHLDELFRYHWLVEEDGAVVVRDWDKYQYAAHASIRRMYETQRKRAWRKTRGDGSPSLDSPSPIEKEIEIEIGVPKRPGHVPDRSGTASTATNGTSPDPWSGFDHRWDGLKASLVPRGWKLPPSGTIDDAKSQRGMWFRWLDASPNTVLEIVADAPADAVATNWSFYQLTAYVKAQLAKRQVAA